MVLRRFHNFRRLFRAVRCGVCFPPGDNGSSTHLSLGTPVRKTPLGCVSSTHRNCENAIEDQGRIRRRRTTAAATLISFVLALGMVPCAQFAPFAAAQNLSGERTVSGTVLSASSKAVSGATVFLKNEKTKSIRSFTSLANGHFHFAQVDKDQDYDLWAEKDGKKSAVKTVSSWDSRTDFVSDLKFK